MMRIRLLPRIPAWAVMLLLTPAIGLAAEKPSAPIPVFEKDIQPVLEAKCLRCHGKDLQKADLDLRSKSGILKGGESGPAISPGSPENSLLWIKIAANKMPPGKTKLTEAEKGLLRHWIESGAKENSKAIAEAPAQSADRQVTEADRQFWAFRKPARPVVPGVRHQERVRNPIDAFVLAALEKQQLMLSPEADRLTLLRRAYFDLIGLPPSPKEMDAFLEDKSSDAYEKLIDRLLASDHYGERWGRHWLDQAGYADSEGILDADYERTAAWRYRDYVIRAFNTDKPYDRFLKEQIAGDEISEYWNAYHAQKQLSPEVVECLVATGYLRCASDTSRPDFAQIKNAPGYYYQTLDDTLKIISSSVLGLTVQCAKCHSHKYDPIPQTDYYRMQAIFMSAYRPYQWVPQVQRRLLEATASQEKEAKEHNAKVDVAVGQLRKQLADVQKQFAERLFADRLARLPGPIRDDVRAALATAPAKRTEVQKYLAGKFERELRPPTNQVPAVLTAAYPEYGAKRQEIETAVKTEESKRHTFAEIRAIYDLPGEAKTPLLRRGDYRNPGPEVQPGVLNVLASSRPFPWSPPGKEAKTSGRRRAFAEWITQPDHPLTARVMVNRIWLHHFGEGIVNTPDNFGRAGSAPSHPELLDWLATEFVAGGWSIKTMHRLIMNSSTYRQISTIDPKLHATAKERDPDNRLLWRQRLRRLEAEVLRDSVLSVAGSFNPEMYGPPVHMVRHADGEVTTPAGPSGNRRSIYLQVRRSQPLTMLQVFDQPVMETNCTRRATSTVSSQALTLLNSDFMVQAADAFAARVLKENADDPVGQALRLAFARPPTDRERARMQEFLKAQTARYASALGKANSPEALRRALADLCHMLLSTNEFAYMD